MDPCFAKMPLRSIYILCLKACLSSPVFWEDYLFDSVCFWMGGLMATQKQIYLRYNQHTSKCFVDAHEHPAAMGDIHFDTNQRQLLIPIVSVVVALALALASLLFLLAVVVVAGPVEVCMSLLPFRIDALNKPSQAIYIETCNTLGCPRYLGSIVTQQLSLSMFEHQYTSTPFTCGL